MNDRRMRVTVYLSVDGLIPCGLVTPLWMSVLVCPSSLDKMGGPSQLSYIFICLARRAGLA